MVRIAALLLIVFTALDAARARAEPAIRFGITAVVVRENVALFSRWADYLGASIGRPVEFIQRRSYREIMDLLEGGRLDLAWICGYPFVRDRERVGLELLAVPLFEDQPLYRSYVIVHRDSPYAELGDLRGRVFAYSDPDSNSGHLVPRLLLARSGWHPDGFFRLAFFTYSHAETVEAVAQGVADGGAVESYVWEFLSQTTPELAGRTRVIARSETFGFPPLVIRRDLPAPLREQLRAALTGMADDAEGRALLDALALDGFGRYGPDLYNSIEDAARTLDALSSSMEAPASRAAMMVR